LATARPGLPVLATQVKRGTNGSMGGSGSSLGADAGGTVGSMCGVGRGPILGAGTGGPTLGNGAKPLGTGGVAKGTGVPWLSAVTKEKKMSASWWRAARWLLLVGRQVGDGCRSARIRPLVATVTVSADEAVGMLTLDGNHNTVSVMRSALIFKIQTREIWRKVVVAAAVAGDEVILECAEGSFSSVQAVEVWRR
jgi:hypothetical protein